MIFGPAEHRLMFLRPRVCRCPPPPARCVLLSGPMAQLNPAAAVPTGVNEDQHTPAGMHLDSDGVIPPPPDRLVWVGSGGRCLAQA